MLCKYLSRESLRELSMIPSPYPSPNPISENFPNRYTRILKWGLSLYENFLDPKLLFMKLEELLAVMLWYCTPLCSLLLIIIQEYLLVSPKAGTDQYHQQTGAVSNTHLACKVVFRFGFFPWRFWKQDDDDMTQKRTIKYTT